MEVGPNRNIDPQQVRITSAIGDRDPGQKGASYHKSKANPPHSKQENEKVRDGDQGQSIDIRI